MPVATRSGVEEANDEIASPQFESLKSSAGRSLDSVDLYLDLGKEAQSARWFKCSRRNFDSTVGEIRPTNCVKYVRSSKGSNEGGSSAYSIPMKVVDEELALPYSQSMCTLSSELGNLPSKQRISPWLEAGANAASYRE